MLSVHVEKRLGDFRLSAKFDSPGGVLALSGPSGAGKTSLVNMIAGLLMPDSGSIALDEQVLFNSQLGFNEPAHRRRIGYVFQEGRLFPHLSVGQNLHYGRWMRGLSLAEAETGRIVDLLKLRDLLRRRPSTLSGGERQRVAIGRALMTHPRFLLLDEPLVSLDAVRKAEILPYLVRLRDELNIPMIYVSHQIDEIEHIATSVLQLERGRVKACGGLELLAQDARIPA